MLPAGNTTSRGTGVAVLIGEGFTPMNSGGEAVGELRLTGLSKGVRVAVNPSSLTTSDNICHIKSIRICVVIEDYLLPFAPFAHRPHTSKHARSRKLAREIDLPGACDDDLVPNQKEHNDDGLVV
jgi:hypothetical protein